jgi:hypothetical protein
MAVSERLAYVHCKPDGTPFYVGKGSQRRAKYLGERNPKHRAVVSKYGRKNILIGSFLCSDNSTALQLEMGLIKRLRAMGIPLTNFTDGGDGGRNPCPETRDRLSKAAKLRGISDACREASRQARLGSPLSPNHKEKLRAAFLGKTFSEEHRNNIRVSAKKRGMSEPVLQKAWAANRGRVRPPEETEKRRQALIATLAIKWGKKETSS